MEIEECLGERLTQILIKLETDFLPVDNEILAAEVVLIFENCQLKILPVIDTDEINAKFSERNDTEEYRDFTELNAFDEYLGKGLSMSWSCHNNNGYFDVLMIAFGNLHPSLLILSEGSALKLFNIRQL